MDSPCLTCTRTKNPNKCENKSCNVWRRWFICEWDKMNSKYAEYIQKEKK